MNLDDKIYIAGHNGLAGSAIARYLKKLGYTNLLTRSRQELDLVNQDQLNHFFNKEKPDYVILAAAKVGGIYANNSYPANFIYENIMIQANVINAAYENNIKRLLFLGSSCIYPKLTEQPIKEDKLLTGELEPTNEPYAIAKIAGIKLCESFNRQHDTDFRSVMPTNLYGINDNFDQKNSHVIPSLIDRFHKAKINNELNVTVWGTGNAVRDFLYVDDMAQAAIFILSLDEKIYKAHTEPMSSHINIGTGVGVTIREVAFTIKDIVGFSGDLCFDKNMPDGTPIKITDITRLKDMGWSHTTSLREGLKTTYDWYLKSFQNNHNL